jgi:hypothetical protein
VVFFEHVNLRVPDHRLATLYFVEGLGLTRDPYRMVGTRNMWVNVGHQQFHLPIGEPTPLPGEVGVVVPDLDAVARDLRRVAPELRGTAFTCEREGAAIRTTTPWGHRVRLLPATGWPAGLPLGLAWVAFDVAPGTAAAIGVFYRDVLGCPVAPCGTEGEAACEVTVGPWQTFRFREQAGAGIVANTNHVAVYLTRYRGTYQALGARGLVMEPDAEEQFRFCDIVDPAEGGRVYRFEHELRSLYHPGYRRPLVNRIPMPVMTD